MVPLPLQLRGLSARRIGGTEGGCHDAAVLFVAQRKSDTAARAAERRRRAQSSYARFSLGGDAGDEELSRKGEGSDAATIGFSGVRPHRRRYRAPGVLQPPAPSRLPVADGATNFKDSIRPSRASAFFRLLLSSSVVVVHSGAQHQLRFILVDTIPPPPPTSSGPGTCTCVLLVLQPA